MGLVEADLVSWCACEYGNQLVSSHASLEDHPLAVRREPSALEGWIQEIL